MKCFPETEGRNYRNCRDCEKHSKISKRESKRMVTDGKIFRNSKTRIQVKVSCCFHRELTALENVLKTMLKKFQRIMIVVFAKTILLSN
jgi:ERCC4-related helicase